MLLAQNTTGQALDVLRNSFELSKNTVDSWESIWEETIFNYKQSGLWIALITLGLTIAAISVLPSAVTNGKTIIEKQSWSEIITMLIWPLVVAFFLGNNGYLLCETIKFIRIIGLDQLQQVQQIQIAGFTFQKALNNITIGNAAREQVEALTSECNGLQNQAFVDCLNQNRTAIEQILIEAEQQNGGPINPLQSFVEEIFKPVDHPGQILGNLPGSIFRNIAIPVIRMLLAAVQWAFVNILEAALILNATFAPIAMGLSLLPLQGRPIFAWLISFISIIGIQLGYNIVVGLAAIVIVNSNGELATDIAFLFFLAVFAPMLAVTISAGGGIALYRGISGGVKQIINLASLGLTKLFI